MNALVFIWRCRLRNSLRQLIHQPAKLVPALLFTLFLGIAFVFSVFDMFKEAQDAAPATVAGSGDGGLVLVEGILLVLVLLITTTSLWTGTKQGGLTFSEADTHFLFTAPISPQAVLIYSLVSTLGSLLVSTIFMFYQLPHLYNAGLRGFSLLAVFFGWFVMLAVSQIASMLLFLIVQAKPELRRPLQGAILALPLATIVLVLLALPWDTLRSSLENPLAFAAFADRALSSPTLRLLPLVGWLHSLLRITIRGFDLTGIIALILLAISTVLMIVAIRHSEADYYEVAAARVVELAERVKKTEKGQNPDRRYSVGHQGIGPGEGAVAFYHKHLREFRRLRPAFVGIMNLVYLAVLAPTAWILQNENVSAPASALILVLVCWLILYWHGLSLPLNDELTNPLFFTSPIAPQAKLVQATRFSLLRIVIDVAPAWLVAGIVAGLNPAAIAIGFVLAWSLCLPMIGGQIIALRLLGSISSTFESIITMLITGTAMTPALALAIIALALSFAGQLTAAWVLALLVPLAAAAAYGIGILFGVQILERGSLR
ncbi:MAG: putative ABC exporter domain-containing protein [Bacillota bacterium]|nr:putative ABC exporter domain-containing protein [Bacillota bacterium]